ncbi:MULTISPECIES: IPT/TIG domain-containing protein [Flavobacterium]|uniref:IPT/TIG domain-containing protein n=1 Tax=Flavobacterium TaxID=237 RepID=UPI001889D3F1|nr:MULTISPECIES: IPT/TIG domain-containing protein [Flavobacterium]MBF4472864.1 IPT/TIG domain-containing protein [Flavobacterium sp. HJJ]
MKNIKNVTLTACIALMFSLMLFSSCSDDSNTSDSAGPPVVESVMPSGYTEDGVILPLAPVTKGDPKSYYIIHGKGLLTTQKVYFNDFETYFRPTFVTDTDIVIMIDESTPYANASNKLKIVTNYGTVLYDFVTAPPPPTFNWFNSINAAAGDVVTIDGKYFLNPVVKVGTQQATIVSSTLTEIKFKMPANSADKLVTVTNITGTAASSLAVGAALYDDAIQGDAGHWTWSGNEFNTNYTVDKAQGNASLKIAFGGWDGADLKFNSRDVSKYKAFRVKIKSTSANPDAKLKFVFGGWAYQIVKSINTSWTIIEIPFSEIGNPTTFDQLTFQEAGNFGGNTILMDEMGFVLK